MNECTSMFFLPFLTKSSNFSDLLFASFRGAKNLCVSVRGDGEGCVKILRHSGFTENSRGKI